jgi:opacity protein-like surface antigen
MIHPLRALIVGGLLAALPVWAVYAPIPEQEQGKDLTFSIKGGVAYDSNIFGSATDERGSAILTLAPRIAYNTSLTPQTFFSAAYGLTLDYFDNRPGDDLLDSHDISARLAHAFSKVTFVDLNELFTISRNPESLLPGQTLNTDQSFTRNQLDGRFVTAITAKISTTLKARSIFYDYHDHELGRSLNRLENLYGWSGDYAILPELKGVAEYRHQDIFYRTLGERKNKTSNYLMGGVDYDVARALSVVGRLGAEWRQRKAEPDATAPYVEFSGRYNYQEASFLTAGYVYTMEETSDPQRFNDTKVHRLFTNLQHAVTALIVASGSLTYEPARLQGRGGNAGIDETTWRAGAALNYLPTKNWTISIGYDYDRVRSDEPSRQLRRQRVGLNAIFAF